jgi:hypothetical protein
METLVSIEHLPFFRQEGIPPVFCCQLAHVAYSEEYDKDDCQEPSGDD